MFLDQILRRQEEYIKSLGPITKPAQKKPLRVKKAPTTLKVVPVYIPDEIEDDIESAIVVEVDEIESAIVVEIDEIESAIVVEIDEIESAIVVEIDETVPEPSLIDTRLIPAYIEPTDDELEEIELLDSGTFELDVAVTENTTIDLASIFDRYVPKSKGAKMTYKMVGLPVPLDIHARMLKFMEANKDKPGAPKSLKDFGLMCLGYTLDDLETSKTDAESVI